MIRLFFAILWQLPQAVLGWAIIKTKGAQPGALINGVPIYVAKDGTGFGVSLGVCIVFGQWGDSPKGRLHEYGHCRQSRMLGPLYLLIVGLPSLIMNILTSWGVLKIDTYYKRWPESWADRLGGVKHNPDGTRSVQAQESNVKTPEALG